MDTKTDQTQLLRQSWSSAANQQRIRQITEQGRPVLIRPRDPNAAWGLTSAEAESILHDYMPELSAVVDGPTMVLFRQQE